MSTATFVENWIASGLVDPAQAEVTISSIGKNATTPEELAKQLIKLGKLTRFQANAIYRGKQSSLVLGSYTLIDLLGAGGMGQVYAAQHRVMKRRVAIKVLSQSLVKNTGAIARFHREVEAASRLNHPNIVTAYDAGRNGGVHFLVMEYVDGCDLHKIVQDKGPFSVSQAVSHVSQAATGLQYAHQQGIIHRDIKPANLLLTHDGIVKILDMGLACLSDCAGVPDHNLTGTGQVMGTLDFMAPEQGLSMREADGRSDIYSLGCTLYFLLTGSPPFHGKTIVEKFLAHRDDPIPSLGINDRQTSDVLEAVFRRMMEKRPEDRFRGMGEVIEALSAILQMKNTVSERTVTSVIRIGETLPGIAPGVTTFTESRVSHSEPSFSVTERLLNLGDTQLDLPQIASLPRRGKNADHNQKHLKHPVLAAGLVFSLIIGLCGLAFQLLSSRQTVGDQRQRAGDRVAAAVGLNPPAALGSTPVIDPDQDLLGKRILDTPVERPEIKVGTHPPFAAKPKLAVAAYFYPSGQNLAYWEQLRDAHSQIAIIVVTGLRLETDQPVADYQVQIEKTCRAGIRVLASVETRRSTRTMEQLQNEIDKAFQWYGVDGIFFDEVSSFPVTCEHVDYYSQLHAYVKRKSASAITVVNNGQILPECYVGKADIQVNAQMAYDDYITGWQPWGWESMYSAENFWHIVHGVDTEKKLLEVLALSKQRNVGYIFVTDRTAETPQGPYGGLPIGSYWDTLLKATADAAE